MTKKIISIFVAVMMVLSIIPAAAFASDGNRRAERPNTAVSLMPRESTRDAADLNEALNVEGGELVFVSEGTYPWVVDGDAAMSGNAGVNSSTSAVSTTVAAVEGDIVQFDFKAWGEGAYTYWDKCEFAIDGTVVFSKGAYQNTEWEAFATELTAGSHTLTWSYTKDSSVSPNGDYFAVDNVYVGQPVMVESISVDPVSVHAGNTVHVSYEVLPAAAVDKTVSFSIADTSIATVDEEGFVTGVAKGTTTITVTSNAVPTVSCTAAVTVIEALPVVNIEGFATYDLANSGLAGNWIGFSDNDPATVNVLGAMNGEAWAGAFAGGSVYGYIHSNGSAGHSFYVMDTETYTVSYPGTTADSVGGVIGMAYNHANQTMYGLSTNNEIVTVDLATGAPTVVASIDNGNIMLLLAIDQQGNAYGMTGAGNLLSIDLTNGSTALIGPTGIAANYVQSMTYDFETNMIYWAQIYDMNTHGLYAVDPETGSAELLGDIGPGGVELTSMYIKNDLSIDDIEMPDVTVTFVDGLDNAVLGTQIVEAGTVLDESTFPAAPEHEGFVFIGWGYDGAAVYTDTTIKAMYQDPNATIWDFESDPVAQGFRFFDEDGDGNNWSWVYPAPDGMRYHEGQGLAVSESYVNNVGALTPDNWIVTPAFHGTMLSFWAQGQDPSHAAEYLGVFISTDGGSTWGDEIFNCTLTGTDTQYIVNLSDYAGQTIKAAIRHYNCTDMFRANVDYIEVSGVGEEPEPTEPTVIDTVEIIGLDAPVLGGTPDMDVSVPEDAHYTLTKVEWHAMNKAIIDGDYVITPGTYYVVFEFAPEEGYEFAPVYDTNMIINGGSELVGLPIFCYSFPNLFHMESTEFVVEDAPAEPTLDEALNVEGGELHFESEGEHPWIVVNDEDNGRLYAMSGNAGVHSSESILTTTITANAGDVVSFEFQAWGEGSGTFWDYCEFAIDGERAGYWGAYQNDWELFTSEPMTAGEHTLTWKFHKDNSVSKPGDCFMVDNVEITEGELPPSGILGDVDMDGQVTTADALMALRYVMGLIELTEDQLAQADVTGEGEITVADPLLILRHAMGLIETFPTEEA